MWWIIVLNRRFKKKKNKKDTYETITILRDSRNFAWLIRKNILQPKMYVPIRLSDTKRTKAKRQLGWWINYNDGDGGNALSCTLKNEVQCQFIISWSERKLLKLFILIFAKRSKYDHSKGYLKCFSHHHHHDWLTYQNSKVLSEVLEAWKFAYIYALFMQQREKFEKTKICPSKYGKKCRKIRGILYNLKTVDRIEALHNSPKGAESRPGWHHAHSYPTSMHVSKANYIFLTFFIFYHRL